MSHHLGSPAARQNFYVFRGDADARQDLAHRFANPARTERSPGHRSG